MQHPLGTGAPFHDHLKTSPIWAYSRYDIYPVLGAVGHFIFNLWLIIGFAARPLWASALLGCLYAVSISWNINSISHAFIHTPFFKPRWMNYLFSLLESVTVGFSQTYYRLVHMRHHLGNSDRKDSHGQTVDMLSIYRYGKKSLPEPVLPYALLSFFRLNKGHLHRAITKHKPFNAYWAQIELGCFCLFIMLGVIYHWQAMLFFAPFYYLGFVLSALNTYYEHFGAQPENPLAAGVSSYNKLYNWLWFNNGYHAEHHYRPNMHWRKLRVLHQQVVEAQQKEAAHVISTCHALGMLAPENRP